MHYYIDGYNLLFRTLGSASGDLKSQRESMIHSLNVKIASLRLDVTVVFDSQYYEGEGSRSHYKHLEICFTPLGVTADEFILEQLKFCQKPQNEIVVTSDRDLATKSRNLAAATESIDEFLGWLNKRYKKKKIPVKKLPQATPPEKGEPKNGIIPAEEKAEKPNIPSEGSLDYYLKHFQEKYHDKNICDNISKPEKNKSKGRKRKIAPIIGINLLSEEERWLKIFQERLKEEL